jgi:NAD(P)H-flavin reductase
VARRRLLTHPGAGRLAGLPLVFPPAVGARGRREAGAPGGRDAGAPGRREAGAPGRREARAPQHAPAAGGDVVLRRRHALTPNLLQLEIDRPAGFDYRPGQHVKLGVPGLLRRYSLVSAPHQRHLEFFVELYPEGRLSERLRALPEGAVMALGPRARGELAVNARRPILLMMATVTGIAPCVSLLRHHTRRPGAPTPGSRFVVVHGASYPDELGYVDELTALARQHPDRIHYLPTVSRPDEAASAGWRGATGRVESQLAGVIEHFGLTPLNTAALACGNPGMIRNVADALRREGYPVQTEPFH